MEKVRGEAEVSTDINEWIIRGHFECPLLIERTEIL